MNLRSIVKKYSAIVGLLWKVFDLMILLYILIIKQVNREFCFWNFNKKITMNRNKYGNNTIIKRKGDVVKLIVIYPKFPLGNIVDPDWEEEYDIVSSTENIETGLYDSEEKRLILKNVAHEAFFMYRDFSLGI